MANKKELNSVLVNLANELDILPSKYKQAVERYTAVANWLKEGEYENVYDELDIYPQGSFRLGTVVRPLKEGKEADYDIDLVCQLPILKSLATPKSLKYSVGNRLKENNTYKRMLDEEGRRCWTLLYAEEDGIGFHLDVLPSIPTDNISRNKLKEIMVLEQYYKHAIDITEKDIETNIYSWKISGSNPRGYALWFDDINRPTLMMVESQQKQAIIKEYASSYAKVEDVPNELIRTPLQRTIQILKRHRDIFFKNKPDNKPISMIITTLVALAYNGETDLVSTLYKVIDTLINYEPLFQLNDETSGLIKRVDGKWRIPNPVNPAENFADRWNDEGSEKPQEFFKWLKQLKQDFNYALKYRDALSIYKYICPMFKMQISQATIEKINITDTSSKNEYPNVIISNPTRPWMP